MPRNLARCQFFRYDRQVVRVAGVLAVRASHRIPR